MDDTGQLEFCLFELFQVAREALETFVDGVAKMGHVENGTVERADLGGEKGHEAEVIEEVEAGRCLIWSHHIKNVNSKPSFLFVLI